MLGYDVEVINYENKSIIDRESVHFPAVKKLIRHPLSSLCEIISLPKRKQRELNFNRFNNEHIRLSATFHNASEFGNIFDTIVVGSDQVWNLECTGNDLTFFLCDGINQQVNKVSYAASFGGSSFPAAYSKVCGSALQSFSEISVREATGAGIVSSLCGRDASVVLDPTLLLEKNEWEALADGAFTAAGDYVFAYMVSERQETLRFARALAKKMRCKLIAIDCYGSPQPLDGTEFRQGAGLEEFISLIMGAKVVVTSSFHGVALSLALGSEVRYSLDHKKMNANSRLEDIARLAGIEDHEISKGFRCQTIDFDVVRKRLEKKRGESRRFLSEALQQM